MSILDTLNNLYETRTDEVEKWLAKARADAAPHFYSSVDLRHSGLRLAPVDTNIFPAGFNNLSPAAQTRASNCIKRYFEENYPQAECVLIIPENHTRNLAYFDNLVVLLSLFKNAGLQAKIGSLIAGPNEILHFISAQGIDIRQYPISSANNKISSADGFTPDVIVLNNDLTSGLPEILRNITQPIIPSPNMGWFQRRKSTHFNEYKDLIEAFCKEFSLKPWLLSAKSHHCGMVDFTNKESLNYLAESIDDILVSTREKYHQYDIKDEPYIYVKADSGTYGMGIISVKSGAEIIGMNKKTRNKMQVIKEGARVSDVIIQEGIPTIDAVDNAPAEPLIYLIDGVPIGGMYRVNGQRDNLGNLNAAGMRFTGMCDEIENESGIWKKVQKCDFRAYGIIAAIAAIAAGREIY